MLPELIDQPDRPSQRVNLKTRLPGEILDSTDLPLHRLRRNQARVAGLLSSLWAMRLAIALGVPEETRLSLETAARHISTRNYLGTLYPSFIPLVDRYRKGDDRDLLVGLLRVAETFAIGSMAPFAQPRATIMFMQSDPEFYPSIVVNALVNACSGGGPGRAVPSSGHDQPAA